MIIKVGVRTTRLSRFLHLFIVRNILEVSVIHLYIRIFPHGVLLNLFFRLIQVSINQNTTPSQR